MGQHIIIEIVMAAINHRRLSPFFSISFSIFFPSSGLNIYVEPFFVCVSNGSAHQTGMNADEELSLWDWIESSKALATHVCCTHQCRAFIFSSLKKKTKSLSKKQESTGMRHMAICCGGNESQPFGKKKTSKDFYIMWRTGSTPQGTS